MTVPLGSATLTVNVAGIFSAPPMGIKGLVISNESPFNVQISLQGTAKGGTLLPETAAFFPVDRGFNGNVTYTPTSVITNPASYTAATLSFEVVGLNEPFDPSSYPIALTRPAVSSTATGKPLFTTSFGVGSSANISQFMSVYNPPNSGVSFTFHSFQAFTSDATLPVSYLVLVHGGDPNLTTPIAAVSHSGDVPSPVSFSHCTALDGNAGGFFTSTATLEPKNLPANTWTEFMTFPDNNTLQPGNALVLEIVSGVSGKTVRMTAKWSEDIAIAPQGGVPTGIVMTSIVNQGNPAPTPVVTASPSGDGATATLINNDGIITLGDSLHQGGLNIVGSGGVIESVTAYTNTAIQNAINAVQNAGKGTVLIPPGIYNFTTGLTITKSGVSLVGNGAGTTIFNAASGSETLAMLVIGDGTNTCADVVIKDIQFTSTNQKTANSAIKIQKGFRTHIERVRTQNQFRAIHVYNSTETWVDDCDIRDTSENGIVFESTLGNGGDCFINSCVADNPVAANTGSGISWLGGENLVIQNCDFIHYQQGFLIAPPTGQKCRFGFIVNAEFDSSSDNCIKIAPTGGDVIAITFTNGWSGTATNYGVLVDGSGGAGLLQGVRFIGHKSLHNGLAGFRLTGGAIDIHLEACDVIGNSQTTSNTRSGVEVASTIGTNWSIIGCRCGNGWQQGSTQQYGVNTDLATYTNVIIISNDFTGNATGGINLNGATLTNSINTNNIV